MRCAILVLLLATGSLARAQEEDGADRESLVSDAREALELLPRREAGRRAAGLLLLALSEDSSDAGGAFSLAMEVRRRMLADLDVDGAMPLLSGLAGIYPHDEALYRRELAGILSGAGRAEEARREYERLLAEDPGDLNTRRALAAHHERRGEYERALGVHDGIIRRRGAAEDFLRRARIRWRAVGDDAGAGRDLKAARRSVEGGPGEWPEAIEREESALRKDRAWRREARGHLRRAHRNLLLTGLLWLALLAGGRWLLRRRGLL